MQKSIDLHLVVLLLISRETNVTHNLDKLSRDEIVGRLSELRKNYPSAFIDGDFKVVEERKGKVKALSNLGK